MKRALVLRRLARQLENEADRLPKQWHGVLLSSWGELTHAAAVLRDIADDAEDIMISGT